MIKIYIASAYSIGDVANNVKRQIDCADWLMNFGFAPFVPLLTHFQHLVHPRPYQDWLDLDFEWIKSCDCLLRLAGESKGADLEVEFALKNNMPVFYSVEDILIHYST